MSKFLEGIYIALTAMIKESISRDKSLICRRTVRGVAQRSLNTSKYGDILMMSLTAGVVTSLMSLRYLFRAYILLVECNFSSQNCFCGLF